MFIVLMMGRMTVLAKFGKAVTLVEWPRRRNRPARLARRAPGF
ncbi:hypothetical protein [Inquilinus sp. CA228]